ncbi:MAG: hypothetical protein V1908_03075 [Candidatus Peregrinibacteria bacterium]
MPQFMNSAMALISSPSFELIKFGGLAYLGLLWLSIIIWVTRDSISRSRSLLFQTFAIMLNIIIPILGVLLYLIFRPGQTLFERYYQEMEQKLLKEAIEEKKPRKKPNA